MTEPQNRTESGSGVVHPPGTEWGVRGPSGRIWRGEDNPASADAEAAAREIATYDPGMTLMCREPGAPDWTVA